MAGTSGLSAEHKIEARDRAVKAAVLVIRHRDEIHYSQGGARWNGITRHLEAKKGEFPRATDCSGMATWCLWNGLYVPYGVRDVVNGTGTWGDGGYTGTMLANGLPVKGGIEHAIRGDCIIYGYGRHQHVTMYLGGGWVMSHGGEAGPLKLRWNYRDDCISIRRYI